MEHQLPFAHGLSRRWLIGLALLAYAAALASLLLPVAPGVALSSGALLALGAAVAWYTLSRISTVATPRLGGRTQAAWMRQRGLALATTGAVYLTLVLGLVTTSTGALWRCMAWPLCPVTDPLTLLAVVHRGAAALSTLLVLALVIQTFRMRSERVLRLAAGWALALLVLQNLLGLVQVVLASQGAHLSTEASRLAHLGLGALVWAALAVLAALVVRLPPSKPVEAQAEKAARVETPSLLKDYVSLTKPGVISLLIFTTFAAMYITPLGAPSLWLVVWTLIGGWLMPAGAHALNCYFDRDIDVLMGRTGRRPIPSGRIPPWHALVLGLALGALAFVILAVFVNMAAALLALAGYFFYVVIYTLMLKRNTFNNIVLGGAARRVSAAGRLGRRHWQPLAGLAVPVRDHLLLDAATLLGAGADSAEGLRQRRRADAAGRCRRCRDQKADPAIHDYDDCADGDSGDAGHVWHALPAAGAGTRRLVPALRARAISRRHHGGTLGPVPLLAALPVSAVHRHDGRPIGIRLTLSAAVAMLP